MACWIDGRSAVLPPDLKAFLDPRSGLGITSDKLSVGREIAVVGAAIDDVWRSERGLQLFGPRHFGLNYDYVPFENLHRCVYATGKTEAQKPTSSRTAKTPRRKRPRSQKLDDLLGRHTHDGICRRSTPKTSTKL